MKKILIVFLKYFLFWLIYFLVAKLIFLLYNFNLTRPLTIAEISGVFFHGLKMDISLVSYLMVFPGIVLAFSFLTSSKILSYIFKIYTFLLLFIITFINIIDLGLYPHWGTRVGISAFDYAGDPQGAVSSVMLNDVLAAVALILFYGILFVWLFNRFLRKSILEAAHQKWY